MADTGATKVRMFRTGGPDTGAAIEIGQEWASIDDAGPALFEFFLQIDPIQATNTSLASVTTNKLFGGRLLLIDDDSLRNGGLHRILGIHQTRVSRRDWGPHFLGDTNWEGEGFQRGYFPWLRGKPQYIEAAGNLYRYYGAYARGLMEAVEDFSKPEWQTDLCTLLSGIASATDGKFRPVVTVNPDDLAFELEARISVGSELFFEVDADGRMEVVLRSDRRGVEEVEVDSIVDLLTIIRAEASL
ncbi:MAG: hypothetical protein O2803_04755 [Chloroflexi bacterium]|nr:hypothetical protein [Chloroflexota bacterium]